MRLPLRLLLGLDNDSEDFTNFNLVGYSLLLLVPLPSLSLSLLLGPLDDVPFEAKSLLGVIFVPLFYAPSNRMSANARVSGSIRQFFEN